MIMKILTPAKQQLWRNWTAGWERQGEMMDRSGSRRVAGASAARAMLVLSASLTAGCASAQPAYEEELFFGSADSIVMRDPASRARVCEKGPPQGRLIKRNLVFGIDKLKYVLSDPSEKDPTCFVEISSTRTDAIYSNTVSFNDRCNLSYEKLDYTIIKARLLNSPSRPAEYMICVYYALFYMNGLNGIGRLDYDSMSMDVSRTPYRFGFPGVAGRFPYQIKVRLLNCDLTSIQPGLTRTRFRKMSPCAPYVKKDI